jgi:SAM-dependent methyltransferase
MSVTSPSEAADNPGAQSRRAGEATACPLCHETQLSLLQSVQTEQLVEAWKVLGVTFTGGVPSEIESAEELKLWHCPSCGFEFSELERAGGAEFYKQLQQQLPNYYPRESPEYSRAILFAREHQLHEVLDVGCGAGAFLDQAGKAGLQTFGVELNPEAAAMARRAGHTIYNQLLSDIIQRGEHRKFELVTTWQVLEHVSDPVGFLADCAKFVAPGGYLAVAVPAEDSINSLCPYNPHVWPPHHVTRWRLKDLRRLGQKVGLRFYRGGNDPMNPYNARNMWELRNQLAPIFGYPEIPGGRILPKAAAAIAARTGLSKLLPAWGHSTYAFFQAS